MEPKISISLGRLAHPLLLLHAYLQPETKGGKLNFVLCNLCNPPTFYNASESIKMRLQKEIAICVVLSVG